MKVLIDATVTQDEIKGNGVGVYFKNLIRTMVKNYPDIEFKLLMYNDPSTIEELLELDNVKVIRIGNYIKKSLSNPMWYLRQLYPGIQIFKHIKKNMDKDTIYFCPYFWNGVPLGVPMVVALHDFALPVFNIYSQINPFLNVARFFTYWIEIFKASFARRIITLAKYTVGDIRKYVPLYKGPIDVTPISDNSNMEQRDISKYFLNDYAQRGYLIYLGGGVTRNKNSDNVVKSYFEFTKNFKDRSKCPYLVIAGGLFTSDQKEAIAIRNLVSELKLDDLVIYTGRYLDEEVYSLCKNSFAFIHLSLHEGFGIAVLESMRSGSPTIAHNGTSYPEVIQDGGILVNGRDPIEVSKAIYKIYSDKDYAKKISQKGMELAKQYSWERTAKLTVESLKKALYN